MQGVRVAGVVVVLLVFGMFLLGCEVQMYKLTVENHQSRDLRPILNGREWGKVKGCSITTLGPAPFAPGQPAPVQLKDESGEVVVDTVVSPSFSDSLRMTLPKAKVTVEERYPGECETLEITTWPPSRTPTATPTGVAR